MTNAAEPIAGRSRWVFVPAFNKRPQNVPKTDRARETEALVDRWILTFLEPPPIADPDLLARVLAEHEETSRS